MAGQSEGVLEHTSARNSKIGQESCWNANREQQPKNQEYSNTNSPNEQKHGREAPGMSPKSTREYQKESPQND